MTVCVDPSGLEEGALIAYLDGEVSEKVQNHLARCSYCVAQVEAYRRTESLLRATLHRHSCPAPERLGLHQLNLLPAGERLVVAKHVRECPHCARELETLARVGDRPSLLERLRQAVGVIEAALLPAPRLQATPLRGLRGTVPALQRYHVEGIEIHINAQMGHDRLRSARTVMGRLVPGDRGTLPAPGMEVWLLQGEKAWAAPVEDGGVFTFEEVKLGEYAVGLEWNEQTVLVRGVKVT